MSKRDTGVGNLDVVIIIPVYKHSVLLVESVLSALSQESVNTNIVIVNDGCPNEETHLNSIILSSAHSNLYYIRQVNGGPSRARNRAIDFIAEKGWNPSAIYYLDSDNKLSSSALRDALRLLNESSDRIGWIYPNISSFEVEWYGDYDVPYSRLLHATHANLCDTGSLVRYDLAKQIRFNEDARSGYEDWDYWLSAIAQGYEGRCSPNFGLEYRNRAESRVKEFMRDHGTVKSYLRSRYGKVFAPSLLIEYEHEEVPRFGFIDLDDHSVHLFSDPLAQTAKCSIPVFLENFCGSFEFGDKIHVPEFIFIGRSFSVLIESMSDNCRMLFWNVQRALCKKDIVAVNISDDHQSLYTQLQTLTPDRATFWGSRVSFLKTLIQEKGAAFSQSETALLSASRLLVNGDRPILSDISTKYFQRALIAFVRFTSLRLRRSASAPLRWRDKIFPNRSNYYLLLEEFLQASPVYPKALKYRKDIAFVVTFGSFGGSEKVAYAVAKELRNVGYRTHLFVIGGQEFRRIDEFDDAFDSINVTGFDSPPNWGGGQRARGVEFFRVDDLGTSSSELIGLLCTMDVVINCQNAPLNAVIAPLRKMGILILYYIHLFDKTHHMRDTGHPFLALLFEHSYDAVLTCSHNLKHLLHGLGLPKEKIITIENNPSFRSSVKGGRDITSHTSEALRVLYIGRLDFQKGIERVLGVIELASSAKLNIKFRLIGANLVEHAVSNNVKHAVASGKIMIEPPVYDSQSLSDIFEVADVLVLPSRWEGAPLVILEAQAAGVVPIATDVGAVSELIDNGVDGFIVDESDTDRICEDIIRHLLQLQSDRKLLNRISSQASRRIARSSWRKSVEPLLSLISKSLQE